MLYSKGGIKGIIHARDGQSQNRAVRHVNTHGRLNILVYADPGHSPPPGKSGNRGTASKNTGPGMETRALPPVFPQTRQSWGFQGPCATPCQPERAKRRQRGNCSLDPHPACLPWWTSACGLPCCHPELFTGSGTQPRASPGKPAKTFGTFS